MAAASRNFGEAHLTAADGVVAHTETSLVSDHPGRCRGHRFILHSTVTTHSFKPALCMIPADMKVFISHSSKNKKVAGRLCDDLRRKKIEVWLDRDQLQSGDPLIAKARKNGYRYEQAEQDLKAVKNEKAARTRRFRVAAAVKDA